MEGSGHDVYFFQEIRLDRQGCNDEAKTLRSKGFNSYWTPAVRTPAGYMSGGASIVCRAWLDTFQDDKAGGPEVARGRVVSCILRTRKAGPVARGLGVA